MKILRKVNEGIHPGDRDRPLPARAHRLQERARPAGLGRTGRGRASAARWPSCTASSRTRATPGPSPAPISTASSTTSACWRRTRPRTIHELASYLQRIRQIGPPHRRTADRAGQPARHCRFRARADRRRRHRGVDRAPARTQRAHLRSAGRQARTRLDEAERARWRIGCSSSAGRSPITSAACCRRRSTALKIRHHGDFHLGQMLIAKDDAYHPRLRGRAGPLAGRAAAEGAGRARRRRPHPLDRLFDHRGAAQRAPTSRPRSARSLDAEARDLARARRPRNSGTPAATLTDACAVARRRRRGAEPARFLPARKSVLRNRIRTDEPSGLAARSPRWNLAHSRAARRGDSHEPFLPQRTPSSTAVTPTRSTISACTSRTTRRWCACSCPMRRP